MATLDTPRMVGVGDARERAVEADGFTVSAGTRVVSAVEQVFAHTTEEQARRIVGGSAVELVQL